MLQNIFQIYTLVFISIVISYPNQNHSAIDVETIRAKAITALFIILALVLDIVPDT